jgi:hypothetical protein
MTGFGMLAVNVVIGAEVSLNARSWSNEAFPFFVGGINARADVAARIRRPPMPFVSFQGEAATAETHTATER